MLKTALDNATPDDAAFLIESMQRNRIESDDSLARMVKLAMENEQLLTSYPNAVHSSQGNNEP